MKTFNVGEEYILDFLQTKDGTRKVLPSWGNDITLRDICRKKTAPKFRYVPKPKEVTVNQSLLCALERKGFNTTTIRLKGRIVLTREGIVLPEEVRNTWKEVIYVQYIVAGGSKLSKKY